MSKMRHQMVTVKVNNIANVTAERGGEKYLKDW